MVENILMKTLILISLHPNYIPILLMNTFDLIFLAVILFINFPLIFNVILQVPFTPSPSGFLFFAEILLPFLTTL